MSNKYPPQYPLEYQSQEVIFYGKKFFIDERVLIPRLETENLVRKAREYLNLHPTDLLIDIGTGSGIIGISLADLVKEVSLLDISDEALEVARHNAHVHQVNATIKNSDLLVSMNWEDHITKNILLVANLPYVQDGDFLHMSEDTKFEPKIALFGGSRTGFELYERLFREIAQLPVKKLSCMIEFGYDQKELAEYILGIFGWKTTFFADQSSIERFAHIEIYKE